MSIIKDLYQAELEAIEAEAEESGQPLSGTEAGKLAYNRAVDRFADMCDAAKDRAKERRGL
jgi:hypothetical protein